MTTNLKRSTGTVEAVYVVVGGEKVAAYADAYGTVWLRHMGESFSPEAGRLSASQLRRVRRATQPRLRLALLSDTRQRAAVAGNYHMVAWCEAAREGSLQAHATVLRLLEQQDERCPVCRGRAERPARRRVAGEVVEGCVHHFHNGALRPGSKDCAWHMRPEAERLRTAGR